MNAEPVSFFFLAQAGATNAVSAQARDKLLTQEQIFELATEYGPKAIGALIVFIAGLFVARYVGQAVMRGLSKRDMEPPVRMLMVRFVKLLILLVAFMMAIQQLGFQLLPLIAGLGVAGVGVGLAMQGVLSNLVAGLTIIFVKPFRVGDYIEINDVEGQVENIELFSTILVHPDLSRVLVPNRKIVGEIIHNYGKIRRADLSVGVAYSTDLNLALDAIRRVLEANPRVLKTPPPVIGTSTLADSSIVIAIKPWAALADFHPMQAEVNKAVVERLRESGIQIPFPQREVRVLPGSELKRAA